MYEKYEQELFERNAIMDKLYNGIPITKEEHSWLATHSLFNRNLGYPFYNMCVEQIKPKTLYIIKIEVKKINYDGRISPVIGVPDNKGYILFDNNVEDINGTIFERKKIKFLGFNKVELHSSFEFEFFSNLGLISIQYECDFFDESVQLHKREMSSTGNPSLAISRNKISDSLIIYNCKNPTSELFNSLIFSVKFIEKHNTV